MGLPIDNVGTQSMSQIIDDASLEAGRAAVSKHAWREAYDHFTSADASGELTAGDLAALGEAAWWLGRLEESISARERAFSAYLDAGDNRNAAVTAIMLADLHHGKLARSLAAGWFQKAERLLGQEPACAEKGFLSVMQALSALMNNDNEAALVAAELALQIGMDFGDRDVQAFGLLLKGRALLGLEQVEEGLSLIDEATVAAVSGELRPLSTGMIYCIAISSTTGLADYERAGEWTEASKRWCDRQAISGFPGICRVHRAEIMRLRGAWADAEQEARRALTELQGFNLEFAAEGFYELGEVRLRMGDLEGAADAFRQAHELGREPQPGLALLWLAEGKVEPARAAIRRALDDPNGDRLHRMRLLPGQVEVELAAGSVEGATPAVDEMEETARIYKSKVFEASAVSARGALLLAQGDGAEAVRTLKRGTRLWRESDLPYETARTRMILGLALRADGDDEGAKLEVGAAKSAFEKLGAVLDLRRALDLLGQDLPETIAKSAIPAERVTKTFVFTDVVGSTKLAAAMGEQAWSDVLAWHDDTLRKVFTAHNGEVVKQLGDGFFAAFEDATEAVECAVAIQKQLADHRRAAGFAPQVRIGLHRSDATRKGRDYEGMGVHEAARIGALAEGGCILASKDVIDAARLRFPVSDLREVELKGVSQPVAVATIDAI